MNDDPAKILHQKFTGCFSDYPFPTRFQHVVTSLSASSGMQLEVTALVCLHLFAGLAGRNARPGFNLAVLPASSASWSALHERVVSPIHHLASMLLDRAKATNTEHLNQWLERQQHTNETDRPDSFDDPFGRQIMVSLKDGNYYRVAASSKPFFMLTDPGEKELIQGINGNFDQSLLVDLGHSTLLDRLLDSPSAQDRMTAIRLARLLSEAHVGIPDPKGTRNPLGLTALRVTAILALNPNAAEKFFQSDTRAIRDLLRHFTFLPADTVDLDWLRRPHPVTKGLELWQDAINDLIIDRRSWSVQWLEHIKEEPRFGSYRCDVLSLEKALPPGVLPLPPSFLHLPLVFLGGLQRLTSPGEREQAFSTNVEAAEGLARIAAAQHVRVLLSSVREENEPIADLQTSEEVMLRKIREKGPLQFRDLLRTYRRQRKADHEPILRRLIETGQVCLTSGGLIDIKEHQEEDKSA